MRWLWKIKTEAIAAAFGAALVISLGALPTQAVAAEFFVYNVYKGLDLGIPGETPQKDFYINMGSTQGIKSGSSLEVLRRAATYDLTSQKLYRDVTFPIARLKVIHVESNAAIARLEKMLPEEKIPSLTPRAVMVGDLVRVPERN